VSASTLGRVRWPLGPLLDVAGHPPARILAAQVGVSPRTVWRWHHLGLSDLQADRAAVALGWHPANIWPHWHNP
jgi:lambda repressor-like predicted transcriptional regulator